MCISPPSPSCSSLFNQIKAERRGEREIEGESGGERERGRFGTSARLFWSLLFVWIGWMMTVLIWNLEDWTTVCLNVSATACIALSRPLALFVYTSLSLFLSFWWYVLFWVFFKRGIPPVLHIRFRVGSTQPAEKVVYCLLWFGGALWVVTDDVIVMSAGWFWPWPGGWTVTYCDWCRIQYFWLIHPTSG